VAFQPRRVLSETPLFAEKIPPPLLPIKSWRQGNAGDAGDSIKSTQKGPDPAKAFVFLGGTFSDDNRSRLAAKGFIIHREKVAGVPPFIIAKKSRRINALFICLF
jgi:hypothetical protein